MAYVKRDANGRLQAVSLTAAGEEWAPLPQDSPEVAAFASAVTSGHSTLVASDLGLVRVLEDLIDLLVEQSVIRFTDLPQAAQSKLLERRSARASMRRLNLLGDGDDLI